MLFLYKLNKLLSDITSKGFHSTTIETLTYLNIVMPYFL